MYVCTFIVGKVNYVHFYFRTSRKEDSHSNPPPIHWATDPSGIPPETIGHLERDILGASTGPDGGLRMIEQKETRNGFIEWTSRPENSNESFGNSISLYEVK